MYIYTGILTQVDCTEVKGSILGSQFHDSLFPIGLGSVLSGILLFLWCDRWRYLGLNDAVCHRFRCSAANQWTLIHRQYKKNFVVVFGAWRHLGLE
ncbi:hypothetical protein CEXT_9611 [Caerostris extrusa]|uniref:Uncharacterized protein n=1 Tax=Caerostris extrusa TaxID=172846 RepID=A0AAV4YEN3_CAEEX|nr:hypothetical protein CEXT_9611 [Caerostris extrusa]